MSNTQEVLGFKTRMDESRKVERHRAGQQPIYCSLGIVDNSGRFEKNLGRMMDSRITRLGIVDAVPSSSHAYLETFGPTTFPKTSRHRYVATVIQNASDDEQDAENQQCESQRQTPKGEILEDSRHKYSDGQNCDEFRDDVTARRTRIQQKMTSSADLTSYQADSGDFEPQEIFTREVSISSDLETDSDTSLFSDDEMVMKPAFVPRSRRWHSRSERTEAGEKCAAHTITKGRNKRNIQEMLATSIKITTDKIVNSEGYTLSDDNYDALCEEDFTKWKIRELNRLKEYADQRYSHCEEMLEISRKNDVGDKKISVEREWNGKLRKQKSIHKFMQKYYHKGAFYMDHTSLSKDVNDVRKKLRRSHWRG